MSDGIKGYPSLYKEQIALRMVSGVTQLYKFGQNLDIDTGTPPEDVWGAGGVYTGFPASAVAMEIVSSDSEDDDAANGDGMRTCQVDYLESATSTKYTRELVSLDGTTPVALNGGNPIYRCNRVVGVTAGDTESNEGTITVRETATPANTSVVVPVGYGQSVVSQWTVPFENTLFITAMDLLVARQGGAAGSLTVLVPDSGRVRGQRMLGCQASLRTVQRSGAAG